MATTSLWHIEDRLKDLIDYVENPEKTAAKTPELQDLYNVFSYVQRPEATQEGEYVTAINCLKETALRQMILTKKRYGKTDGYIAWHGYQSFKPEEVTPQLAHEIGVKLAKEMWGDRFEIIVTTHLDKEHLHCHFCFNSVSFRDGGKYNYSKAEQQRLREASDRLCREYGLSVIEKPHKAPSRPVWLDEKSGKPTRYNVYRADVQEAIDFSRTPYYMEDYLRRKGYITDFTGKHWKIRLPQYEHFTRLDTLIARRTKLQNKIRRAAPAEKEPLQQKKAGVTEQITVLRKQLKLNKAIEVRSAQIQEKTNLLYANEHRAKEEQQRKKSQRRERDAR